MYGGASDSKLSLFLWHIYRQGVTDMSDYGGVTAREQAGDCMVCFKIRSLSTKPNVF